MMMKRGHSNELTTTTHGRHWHEYKGLTIPSGYCCVCDGAPCSELRLPLAVSQARDVSVKTPHAVLIDQTDTPVALVYGHSEAEARERAERAVVMLSGYAGLVECLRDELEAIRVWQSARGISADVRDGLQISAAKIQAALTRVRDGQVEVVKPKTEARRHHFRSNWSGNSCEYRIKPAGYGVRGGRVYEFCNQAATAPVHFQAKQETGGNR